jgi:4-hydroxythreonine-4-phosphate dehydrogenase
MNKKNIIVGISHGDINGVGYEIIIKTLANPMINDICTPIVYGSPKVAAYHRKALNIANFSFNNIKTPSEANSRKANIISCIDDDIRVELGKPTTESGEAAIVSLERAVNDLKNGKIDALVTAPIDKRNVQSEKFRFSGHTEYLMHKAEAKEVLMFMISDSMRIGFVTGHVPLKKVSEQLSIDVIMSKLRIMNNSLIKDFAIRKPKIAVLGLNPHAGDNSLLGNEEADFIIPALKKANDEGILTFGPFAADGFFGAGMFKRYDAILSMYHDQGLTPFKALSFDTGINFTAGLPFIRTSPTHGTAFNISGKGEASENSFRQAMYLACDIFRNRQLYSEITKNPLEQQDVNLRSDKADELPPEIDN